MLVMHALWSPGHGLLIWAVDGDRAVTSPSQAVRAARPHPFAATVDRLAEIATGRPTSATLLLPSLRKAPLDSPEIVRVAARPAAQRPPTLLPWVGPTLVADPRQLDRECPDVRYGRSVAALRAVLAFADELVARGRVLPSLVFEEGRPAARWRPVVTGPDAAALHGLVAALPPVARAERDGPGGTAGQDPAALVADALGVLADSAVRAALLRSPAPLRLPPRRGRRPSRAPAAEPWVMALGAADGRFPADQAVDEAGLDELAQALSCWDDVGAARTGPARGLFWLAEPATGPPPDQGAWRLEFLLQSTTDPSLQVSAERVWTAPTGLHRWID